MICCANSQHLPAWKLPVWPTATGGRSLGFPLWALFFQLVTARKHSFLTLAVLVARSPLKEPYNYCPHHALCAFRMAFSFVKRAASKAASEECVSAVPGDHFGA